MHPKNLLHLIVHLQNKYPSQMGFFYGLLSNFIFNCGNYVSRHVSANHSPSQVVYMFSFQMFSYNYLLLRARNIPFILPGGFVNSLAIGRGLLTIICCALLFNAFPMLSYSESLVILNIGPIVSALLAVWLLKERCGWDLLVNSMLSILGILLISKPSFLFGEVENNIFPNRSLGIMMILLCVLIGAYGTIVTKRLSDKSDASIMAAHLGMCLAIGFGPMQIFMGATSLTFNEYVLLAINGFLEAAGQLLTGQAFKYGDATTMSIMGYSRILYAYLTEILIDGIVPDFLSIVGSVLVFSSLFVSFYSSSTANNSAKQSQTFRRSISNQWV